MKHVYLYYGRADEMEPWLNSLPGRLIAVFSYGESPAIVAVTEELTDEPEGTRGYETSKPADEIHESKSGRVYVWNRKAER